MPGEMLPHLADDRGILCVQFSKIELPYAILHPVTVIYRRLTRCDIALIDPPHPPLLKRASTMPSSSHISSQPSERYPASAPALFHRVVAIIPFLYLAAAHGHEIGIPLRPFR